MRLTRLLAPLVTLAGLLVAAPAQADATVTPNACRYSYDNYYRDTGVSLSGAGTIVPTAARPAATEVVPGQHVDLSGATLHFVFPEILARFGYAAGYLEPGDNTITANVWVALEASNTKEHVQVVGPLTVTATTTIVTDPTDDDRFISSTPFAYTDPVLPDTTWTATGGDVALSQAAHGTLPDLPVGPSGGVRTPIGSAVIQATLNGLNFVMDCTPGAATDVNPSDGAGPDYGPAVASPFDTVAGPQNATCLDDPGRQVSGAAANLPSGIDRELDPLTLSLTGPSAPPMFATGVPYTFSGAHLRAVLGADTVATLGRFTDAGTPLIVADHAYPLHVWVALAASNTTEGVQTVAATATYTLHPAVTPVTASSAWAASEIVVDIPPTTWTPTGAGPIVFSGAQPGAMTAITVTGPAAGGPGGDPVSTTFAVRPYGSVVLRGDTQRNPVSLDCVPGAIGLADAGVAWSNLGRAPAPEGSAGRYAIDVPSTLPALATASRGLAPGDGGGSGDGDGSGSGTGGGDGTGGGSAAGGGGSPSGDGVTPVSVPESVPVVAKPPPAAVLVAPGSVASLRLRSDRRGHVKLAVRCPRGGATCRGSVRITSAVKVKVGKRKLLLTLVGARSYTAKAGRSTVLTLPLAASARVMLKHRRSLRVLATLQPASGAAARRTLTLSY